MFAREMRETARQTLFVLAFYILVPVLYLIDLTGVRSQMTLLWYLSNGLNLTIVILIVYLAWNLFRPEERDGATEYLLSLPVSKWKILLSKVLPRLIVLIPILVIDQTLVNLRYSIESAISGRILYATFLHSLYIASLVVLCGFVLGIIGRKRILSVSIMAMVTLTYYNGIVFFYLSRGFRLLGIQMPYDLFRFLMRNHTTVDYLLFVAVLALISWPLLRRWDMGSSEGRDLLFAKRAFIPMLLLIVPFIRVLGMF